MNKEVYIQYRNELKNHGPSDAKASVHMLIFFALMLGGIALAIQESTILYIIGEILIILGMANSQSLLHELGHRQFFKTRSLNDFFGNIVALVPAIPYYPWVYIHSGHHKWSGNKEKDPTTVDKNYEDLTESEKKVMNFCWKYWIPIFGFSYSLNAFWNIKKLKSLYPRDMSKFYFSMLALILFYGTIIALVPFGTLLKVWAPAYFLFIAICEPLLFSQHVHIDQADVTDPDFHENSTYHVSEQDEFSRTLTMPEWISHWILIGFNKHAIHHIFPNLPGYNYHLVKEEFPNTMKATEWYKQSKKVDAATLLFKTKCETGLIKT